MVDARIMPVAPLSVRFPALCAIALASLALPATASAKKTSSPKLPATFQHRFHVKSAVADPDGDGLTNFTEYRAHTNPKKVDTDKDGSPDAAEDRDRDGLDNASEQRAGTDPAKKDTDHDGKSDAREDADHDGLNNLAEQNTANDPGDPDSDDDGIEDGNEHAGRVLSFRDGDLTLRLASTGQTITAAVDDVTSVECNATDEYEDGYDDGAADDTFGDDGSASDDTPADDGTGDTASDDNEDDVASDDADASAASVRAVTADATGDDTSGDETPAGEDAADDDTGDCDTVLAAGAWVHESELTTADDGSPLFDAVKLVDDAQDA